MASLKDLIVLGPARFLDKIYGNLEGNASSADKLKTARSISLAGKVTGSTSFDGSGNVSITTSLAKNYAGSSTDGGIANTALKLVNSSGTAYSIGSATEPVYFSNGVPVKANTIENAKSAEYLSPGAKINGTLFIGSTDITTSTWGTARNIYIADSDSSHTGAAVSVNGGGNVTLKLPSTIKATLTGNASTATTATYALKMQTYKYNSTTETYGTSYPLYAQWNQQGNTLLLKCDNYTVNTDSATKLQTARSINGTNFDGTGNITTANWGTARTITIGAAAKSVNGSTNYSWSPYEMRVTRAQYGVDTSMNVIADNGCELGMASLSSSDTTINPGGGTGWHHYINMTWTDCADNNGSTTNEWCTQIANKVGSTDLWVRSRSGGSITDGTAWGAPWTRIVTGSNFTTVLNGTYVNVSGDTMTGALNFANGTWNAMGDDAYIGDYNQAGKIGIKGKNGNTGIYFEPYSGSTAQTITINGSGTMTISGTVASTFSGNLSGTASNANRLLPQSTATSCNNPGIYCIHAGGATVGNTNNYSADTPNLYTSVQYGTILRMKYNNSSVYYTDIYSDTNQNALYLKTISNGTSKGWVRIVDSTYGDNRYLGKTAQAASATTATYLVEDKSFNLTRHSLQYFNINGAAGNAFKVNDTPTSAWWHIMRCTHANSAGYYTDLAIPFNDVSLYYKRIANGTVQNNGWIKVLDSNNYTSYTVKKDGTGASGTWGINVTGSSASCTGNAASATKLATARNIVLSGDLAGSASFNGTANATITTTNYKCSVNGGNTNSFPYHRIAYITGKTGQWTDCDCILDIKHNYNTGGFGRVKISFRSNGTGTAVQASATWLYKYNIKDDAISIAYWGTTGQSCYADVFYNHEKTYPRCTVYQVYGGRVWTLVDSNQPNDGATPTEAYASISAAATALHGGTAYTNIVESTQANSVGILPISGGGTGANTPAGALSNLGGVGYTVVTNLSSLL